MKKLLTTTVALLLSFSTLIADPFLGEIRIFAGNFAPRDWALCDGQLLSINDNQALFSLLGTIYGGDGRTTFALPDLRGRTPIHAGSAPGLTHRPVGSRGGSEIHTLTPAQVPSHTHSLRGTSQTATTETATGAMLATTPQNASGVRSYHPSNTELITLHSDSIEAYGGGQPHNNMPPFLSVNYIICLSGTYPPRN
jgi:microcystin-dependent protein